MNTEKRTELGSDSKANGSIQRGKHRKRNRVLTEEEMRARHHKCESKLKQMDFRDFTLFLTHNIPREMRKVWGACYQAHRKHVPETVRRKLNLATRGEDLKQPAEPWVAFAFSQSVMSNHPNTSNFIKTMHPLHFLLCFTHCCDVGLRSTIHRSYSWGQLRNQRDSSHRVTEGGQRHLRSVCKLVSRVPQSIAGGNITAGHI